MAKMRLEVAVFLLTDTYMLSSTMYSQNGVLLMKHIYAGFDVTDGLPQLSWVYGENSSAAEMDE